LLLLILLIPLLAIMFLPHISWAFTKATATFPDIGTFDIKGVQFHYIKPGVLKYPSESVDSLGPLVLKTDAAAIPILFQKAASNHVFEEVQIEIHEDNGQSGLSILTLNLFNVTIVQITTSQDSGGEDKLTVDITLNFNLFTVKYTPQDGDPSSSGDVPMEWESEKK
jgi:type VI protein secretion system component Hcp